MRRTRAPDNVDIMDVMTESITSCVSQLTAALQVPRVPLPHPTQAQPRSIPSLSDQIETLYKRRKMAVDAGFNDSVAKYQSQITRLESLDEDRINAQFNSNQNC